MFSKGALKKSKGGKHRFKPKPSNWDSDLDGDWEDQPGALLRPDEENGSVMDVEDEEEDEAPKPRPARGRGRGRGGRGGANRTTTKTTAAPRKPTVAPSRARKKVVEEYDDEDEEDEDVVMLDDDDDDDDDSQAMFFKDKSKGASTRGKKSTSVSTGTRKATSPIRKPPPRAATTKGKQATLNFTASQASVLGTGRRGTRGQSLSDNVEDEDDDDDAFEPVSSARTKSRR
jgi:double-strand break repair protein MRE11